MRSNSVSTGRGLQQVSPRHPSPPLHSQHFLRTRGETYRRRFRCAGRLSRHVFDSVFPICHIYANHSFSCSAFFKLLYFRPRCVQAFQLLSSICRFCHYFGFFCLEVCDRIICISHARRYNHLYLCPEIQAKGRFISMLIPKTALIFHHRHRISLG